MTLPGDARAPLPTTGPAVSRLGATIARNAVFSVVGRFTFLLAWALITPYMLRVLGVERFAIWALFFSISAYFVAFDIGLSQALIKFVAQFSAAGDARSLRGVVTLGTLAYVVLTAPVVVALAAFQRPILDSIHTPAAIRAEASWTLVGMGIVLGMNNLAGIVSAILIGKQRLDVTNRIQLIVTAIQVGGAIAALRFGFGLRGLVAAFGAGVLVNGLLSLSAVRSIEPAARLDLSAMSRGLMARLFHFSAALQITNIGTFFQYQLDKFLLAHFATLAVVTQFELVSRLGLGAWVLPLLLIPPLVPAVAQLRSLSDDDRIHRLYIRASRYVAAIAFPLAAFMAVSAPALFMLWLGPGYPDIGRAMAALMAFLLLGMLTGVGTAVNRGMGEPWLEARFHVIGTIAHVGLSLWLVPRMGLLGALLSMILSIVVSVVYFLIRFHARIGESHGHWLRSVVLIPLVTSGVAAALVIAWRRGYSIEFPNRLAALADVARCGLVFGIVVGVTYMATKFVTVSEFRGLRRGSSVP